MVPRGAEVGPPPRVWRTPSARNHTPNNAAPVMNGLTRDDILDNISVKGASLPVAVSVFPDELYQAPRSCAEQAFPKLIHFNKLPKGAHFAAFEQPQLPFRRASCRLQIT